MSVYNTLPASVYIIDRIFPGGRPPVTLLQLASASVTLVTATVLVVTQVGLDFSDSAYFWLVVGVICSVTYTLHCRFVITLHIWTKQPPRQKLPLVHDAFLRLKESHSSGK